MTRFILKLIIPGAAALLLLGGCGRHGSASESTGGPLRGNALIDSIITAGDSSRFASLCNYPIERPYPLRNLDDSTAMANYFTLLFDGSVRSNRKPAWENLGWRGSVRDDAGLWTDEGRIYAVDSLSQIEKAMRAMLSANEIASLPEDMRRGWQPVECLVETEGSQVYRIDYLADSANAGDPRRGTYRLAEYSGAPEPGERPAATATGRLILEGSMGVRRFSFVDTRGDTITYCPDDDLPEINGQPVEHAYWRDLLRTRR